MLWGKRCCLSLIAILLHTDWDQRGERKYNDFPPRPAPAWQSNRWDPAQSIALICSLKKKKKKFHPSRGFPPARRFNNATSELQTPGMNHRDASAPAGYSPRPAPLLLLLLPPGRRSPPAPPWSPGPSPGRCRPAAARPFVPPRRRRQRRCPRGGGAPVRPQRGTAGCAGERGTAARQNQGATGTRSAGAADTWLLRHRGDARTGTASGGGSAGTSRLDRAFAKTGWPRWPSTSLPTWDSALSTEEFPSPGDDASLRAAHRGTT